jgi:hypothetical protein
MGPPVSNGAGRPGQDDPATGSTDEVSYTAEHSAARARRRPKTQEKRGAEAAASAVWLSRSAGAPLPAVAMTDDDDLVRRGEQIARSGKYAPPLGKYLGRIDAWGLDVFENSPPEWIDALLDEMARTQRGRGR